MGGSPYGFSPYSPYHQSIQLTPYNQMSTIHNAGYGSIL
jgi:hypothetical protein